MAQYSGYRSGFCGNGLFGGQLPLGGWIPAICVLLLLQYARSWKQTALWQQSFVSSLAALAVLIPALFEPELFYALKDYLVAAALEVWATAHPLPAPKHIRRGLP